MTVRNGRMEVIMNRQWSNIRTATLFGSVFLITMNAAHGQAPEATVDMVPHAKAPVVLKLSFPTWGDLSGASILFSEDGETFENTRAGLPRNWELFTSISDDGETTTVLILVVGRFNLSPDGFLFSEPGTYYLRWGVGFEDKEVKGLKVEQPVEVAPAREADLAFLDRLAEPKFLRHLFEKDLFDPSYDFGKWVLSPDGRDYRALFVIAELLKLTRAKEPGDAVGPRGSLEQAIKWAEALNALAKELPESSYAPYAAYYAGCCYITSAMIGTKEERGEYITPATRRHPHYKLANEILRFVAEHGDAYLKPRALYMQAILRMVGADWIEADRSLTKALESAPGEGTIKSQVDELRRDIQEEKEKQAKRKQKKNS